LVRDQRDNPKGNTGRYTHTEIRLLDGIGGADVWPSFLRKKNRSGVCLPGQGTGLRVAKCPGGRYKYELGRDLYNLYAFNRKEVASGCRRFAVLKEKAGRGAHHGSGWDYTLQHLRALWRRTHRPHTESD